MAGLTSALNPNVVKTALDDVFYQEFDRGMHPGYADANSAAIFKQESADSSAVIQEVFQGTGLWSNKPESADVVGASPKVGNQITFSIADYAQSIDISKNFFDDNKHGVYSRAISDMAETGRITRDNNAFAIFRGAFLTSLTADGLALCANAHVTLSGAIVDNYITAVLSEASLNTAMVKLMEQKAQDGTIRGSVGSVLLVPPALFKPASEITGSELRSGTADNDINVYSSKYGLQVMMSPYMGAAAGGSDTAWFLLARNHSVMRWVRQGVETALIDWRYQRNNNYIYKADFREQYGALDYAGIVGSDGTV